MLRKRGEILDTGYFSHTMDAATRVQRTHSLGSQACQAPGTLTSTPADGGHRGSKCVHRRRACFEKPTAESMPTSGIRLHSGKSVAFREGNESKGEKTVGVWALPLGRRGPGAVPSQVHSQCHARFQVLWKEGFALRRGNTYPWKVPRQLFIPHPTQETQALQTRDFNSSLKRLLSKSPNIFQRRQKSTFLTPRDKTTTTKEPQTAMLVH